jgi:hypothetical protein
MDDKTCSCKRARQCEDERAVLERFKVAVTTAVGLEGTGAARMLAV